MPSNYLYHCKYKNVWDNKTRRYRCCKNNKIYDNYCAIHYKFYSDIVIKIQKIYKGYYIRKKIKYLL